MKSRVKVWRALTVKANFLEITFPRSHSDISVVARLMTPDFTTRDRPLLKPHNPYQLELGGPGNPEIIESRMKYTLKPLFGTFLIQLYFSQSSINPKTE